MRTALGWMVFVCILAFSILASSTQQSAVEEILQGLPSDTSAAFAANMMKLLGMPEDVLIKVCMFLESEDVQEKARAEYAISGLVKFVGTRQGVESRAKVASCLIKALEELETSEAKSFLIEQIGYVGEPKIVPLLAKYIDEEKLRDPVCRALVTLGGRAAQQCLLDALESIPENQRVPAILALGELRSRKAIKILHSYVDSQDDAVRTAAFSALAKIGDRRSQPIFVQLVRSMKHKSYPADLIAICFEYISRLGERRLPGGAKQLCLMMLDDEQAPSQVRCSALHTMSSIDKPGTFRWVLEAVEVDDAAYRSTALSIAVNYRGARYTNYWKERLRQVEPYRQAEILTMLGRRGDPTAIPVIREYIHNSSDEQVRCAAIEAGKQLLGVKIVEDLLLLMEGDLSDEPLLATLEKTFLQLPLESFVGMLQDMYLKLSSQKKQVALRVFAAKRATEACPTVLSALEDSQTEVRNAAWVALGRIGSEEHLPIFQEKLKNGVVSEEEWKFFMEGYLSLIKQVPDFETRLNPLYEIYPSADENLKGRVRELVQGVCNIPDRDGFVMLFNGIDLTGWTGDTAGYVAENGVMVCKPGGNLYTEKEYSNFIFHFEFKLTPGANNGVAVRAPIGGGAYNGMEIQILDDYADVYKDLKPWQYCGSIYGIVPVRRGFLKPAGEWNVEQIIARGRQITVVLNGEVVVDANLDEATTPAPMDGKVHQGLDREKGHLGFLGHGTVLEFRNIKIKEL